jgi:hypothetical protein
MEDGSSKMGYGGDAGAFEGKLTEVQTSVKGGFGLGSNRNLKSRFLAQVQT